VGAVPGHLDGHAARGRPGRPAAPAASDLVACGHQVGADDLGHADLCRHPDRRPAQHPAVRPGRRPRPVGTVKRPASDKAYNSAGAADPGLVYDLGATDYKKYLCGAGMTSECSGVTAISGGALNLPSITINNVLGTASVTRSVTNVGSSAATYSGSVAISGYSATLSRRPA
jgi:hypothetical protein